LRSTRLEHGENRHRQTCTAIHPAGRSLFSNRQTAVKSAEPLSARNGRRRHCACISMIASFKETNRGNLRGRAYRLTWHSLVHCLHCVTPLATKCSYVKHRRGEEGSDIFLLFAKGEATGTKLSLHPSPGR